MRMRIASTLALATVLVGCTAGPPGVPSPSGGAGSPVGGVPAGAPSAAASAAETAGAAGAAGPLSAGPGGTPSAAASSPSATLPPGAPLPDGEAGRFDDAMNAFAHLDLLASGDAYYSPADMIVVHDRYAVSGDTIAFAGESCGGELGTYRWTVTSETLSMRRIADPCRTRSAALVRAFARAHDQLPYATVTRSPVSIAQPGYNLATADSGGHFFMTDGGTGFYEYGSDGSSIGAWAGALSYATGVTVAPSGDIYVADFDQAKVRRFDSAGKLADSFTVGGGAVGPVGLAHDAAGDIYVALHRAHPFHVEKYSPDGRLLASWAPEGSGSGEVGGGERSGPENLAVDRAGNIIVTDPVNKRLDEYDAKGRFVRDFTGTADAPLDAGDVAVDSKGNVYTLVEQAIWRFDPSGNSTGRWFVAYPGALVVDSRDRIHLVGATIADVTLPPT